MIRIKAWVASAAGLAALLGGAAVNLLRASVRQPIAFNHSVHLKGAGMACPDCHIHALDGERATIPSVDLCATCHDNAQGHSAAEAAVVEHVRTKQSIPWRKVYLVPDHVYFSHRRHTTLGGITCETCHGGIGDLTRPLTRQLVPVTMNRCIGCHDRRGVLNDCVGCHR